MRFGIPVFGTMAHSFVQAHASELAAFKAFARARPQRPTLLVDTYDTEAAVTKIIGMTSRLEADSLGIGGVRTDSGDLGAHAIAVRRLLDEAGLSTVSILAGGNLDEHRIAQLVAAGAPIDAFGVGTALDTSSDVPALDAVYKLQAYAGVPRRKRSEGKATWPGPKQVGRILDDNGRMLRDVVQLEDEIPSAPPLLQPVMLAGQRVSPPPSLHDIRQHHASQMLLLPAALRCLEPAPRPYDVVISEALRGLVRQTDALQR